MSGVQKTKDQKGLSYPFDAPPAFGQMHEVAKGVRWLRMPLPYSLDHINLWLIADGEGWALVDTGVSDSTTTGHWLEIFEKQLGGQPVTRLIVTHMHPDHVGMAGWISRKFGVTLEMSRGDYLMCRAMVADHGREAPEEAIRFYRAAGFSERGLDRYRARFGSFGERVYKLPDIYKRLQDRDILSIGGDRWHVITGAGHAPEHVCLYAPERGLFIAGDQLLPRISSNVSLHPTESAGNPLQEWIDSCRKLIDALAKDTLVLPSHNEPFTGAHARLERLISGHEKGLARLYKTIAEPKRAIDVFGALFARKISPDNFFMATGESLAHLACLVARGQASVERDENGVDWYRAV